MKNRFNLFIFIVIANLSLLASMAARAEIADPLISLFPIEHYSQNINDWIKPTDYPDPDLGVDQDPEGLVSLAAKTGFKLVYLDQPNVNASY